LLILLYFTLISLKLLNLFGRIPFASVSAKNMWPLYGYLDYASSFAQKKRCRSACHTCPSPKTVAAG
jgi:hypothetical protein